MPPTLHGPFDSKLRTILILGCFTKDTQRVDDLILTYSHSTGEQIDAQTVGGIIGDLLKMRMLRNASSRGGEIHASEIEDGVKAYTITPAGIEFLREAKAGWAKNDLVDLDRKVKEDDEE